MGRADDTPAMRNLAASQGLAKDGPDAGGEARAMPMVQRVRDRAAQGLAATAPVMAALVALLALRGTAQASDLPGDGGGGSAAGLPSAGGGQGAIIVGGGSGDLIGSGGAGGTGGGGSGIGLLGGLFPSAAAGELGLGGGGTTGMAAAAPTAGRLAASSVDGGGGTGGTSSGLSLSGPSGAGAADAAANAAETAPTTTELPTADPIVVPEEDGSIAPPIGEFITGTGGNDLLIGTDKADTILGGDGDDQIFGRDGNDDLFGEEGNDQVFGENGNDTVNGGPGNDFVDGGPGDDLVIGGTGSDFATGGTGVDIVLGAGQGPTPTPTQVGDAGFPVEEPDNDIIDGGVDNETDILSGWGGDDTYILRSMRDILDETLNPDDNRLLGTDTMVVGNDYTANTLADPDLAAIVPGGLVTFRMGNSLAPAPVGANPYEQQVPLGLENVRLEGTDAHDVVGDDEGNAIWGNEADNILIGGAGADSLDGGRGTDLLAGGLGDDQLMGGLGNDLLAGHEGQDLLYGGEGDDTYVLGLSDSAVDTIFDHQGNDVVRLEGGDPTKVGIQFASDGVKLAYDGRVIATFANDPVSGASTSVVAVDSGQGPQSLFALPRYEPPPEPVTPPPSEPPVAVDPPAAEPPAPPELVTTDLGTGLGITGNGADNLIQGGAGDDRLAGGAGRDSLYGEAGNDILAGGADADRLHGGPGNDIYELGVTETAPDTIHDYEGTDVARLSGADPSKVVVLFGADGLQLGYDGRLVATFANDPGGASTTVSGVDVGQGPQSLFDFLSFEPQTLTSEPPADLLSAQLTQGDSASGSLNALSFAAPANDQPAAGGAASSAPLPDFGSAAGFAISHDLWQPTEAGTGSIASDADRWVAEEAARNQAHG